MGLDPSKPTLQSVGRYDILEMIAEGGMGTVYKGRNRETNDIVAIKIVPPSAAKNPTLLKRFEREFTAARNLDHPNIVKAIEFNGTCAEPFLVMEFVDGESLGQKIEREGKMPEAVALRVIAQVSQGLHRAHKQGLIHRDVKPDNVLVTPDGTAKLTDLGLVKDTEEENNLTRTGRGLGTPHFMAPEQFRDAKNANERCDIYSLGATLYMMVTGQMPFGSSSALDCFMKKLKNEIPTPREIAPEITERVDWAIRRAMSGEPDKRPASCREFVEDLYGRSTRPQTAPEQQSVAEQDLWYLVYQDETGASHTVKGGTEGIRRALRERLLGDASNIMACQKKTGPFQALKSYPEFRDLLVSAEAAPVPGRTPTKTTPGAGPSGRMDPRVSAAKTAQRSAHSGRYAQPSTASSNPNSPLADGSSSRLPHLKLVAKRRPGFDVFLWLLVLVISLATALAVYYLFPPK